MDRGSRIKEEIKGVLAVLAGLIIAISLISHSPEDQSFFTLSSQLTNLLGTFGSNLSETMLQAVGYASYLFPLILIISGIKTVLGKTLSRNLLLLIAAFSIVVFSASALISLAFGGHSGGVVGIFSTDLTLKIVSTTGSYLIFATFILVSLMYLLELSLVNIAGHFRNKISLVLNTISSMREKRKKSVKQPRIDEPKIPEPSYIQESLPLDEPKIRVKPQLKTISRPIKKISSDYELPDIELLNDPPPSKTKPLKEELIDRSDLLERKLLDYAIEGKVTYVSPGPIVTMFEFEPAPGIKISKVMSLADDLAMALKAISIRISPIHGRSTLGIEVPNKDREDVFLREIISNDAFNKSHSKLTVAFGKDIFGVPVLADLAKMPHLLIAGATGSGKSVGMNSIIVSLLYRSTPKEVKMLMIDPKMLELSAYEEIPHLLMPVITLPKEASNALKRLVIEMERRYRLLADSGARNIEAYNKKVVSANSKPDRLTKTKKSFFLILLYLLTNLLISCLHQAGRLKTQSQDLLRWHGPQEFT
jgi:S-DNA-T family DNA segregation ATPase FtsK/SpoIIIE